MADNKFTGMDGYKVRNSPNMGRFGEPFTSDDARLEAGFLLRRLQRGDNVGLPKSRPMPTVGARCHELRIPDGKLTWRIMYRIDSDAVIIIEVFAKKTKTTPKRVIDICKERLKVYNRESK